MDITLINITSKTTYDGKLVNTLSTVGIYSLIACLEREGVGVDFREYFLDFEKPPSKEVSDSLEFFSNSAKIIAIGCHAIHLPFAVKVSQLIKKNYPDKIIILGGIGPSIVAVPLMKKIKEIDIIIVGEAEISFPKVVRAVLFGQKDFADIPGLVYRKRAKVIQTPPAARIKDLDVLPLPAYKYLDTKLYSQPMAMSARGCPFNCPFCSLGAYWKGMVSFRSIGKICEELKLMQDLGVKFVFFADPCFMLKKERLTEFIKEARRNLNMSYKCYGRLDLVDENICSQLCESNFKVIFFGLESGSDNVLKNIKRGFNVREGLDIIKRNARYFSKVEVSLMWGFPFETLEDLKKTIDVHNYLKEELNCAVQLTWFQPFANTFYFRKYRKTLIRPKSLSAIYDRDKGASQVRNTLGYSGEYDYTISLRSMIGHSHVYSIADKLIDDNPDIFPDFYRYHTPDLDKKIRALNKIVPV